MRYRNPKAVFLKVKVLKSKLLINANPIGNAISAKIKLKPILFFILFVVFKDANMV